MQGNQSYVNSPWQYKHLVTQHEPVFLYDIKSAKGRCVVRWVDMIIKRMMSK